ncbi:MAG: hypothetical protein HYT70_03395 [Candidatus Aenigmarchaeota archaeon]|nr:hypothetical protein [Candidatus Aenigmarchaeota archaeon]
MSKKLDDKGKTRSRELEMESPAIGIDEAIQLIKKGYERGGDEILTFEEICRHMGIKGGSRSRYMASLKMYGLVAKTGTLGWQITELGKKVASDDKDAIAQSFLTPDIHNEIKAAYPSRPSLGSVIAFLKKKKIKVSPGIVANRYIEGFEYVQKINPNLEVVKPEQKDMKMSQKKFNEDVLKAIRVIGVFLPLEDVKDEKVAINTLSELAKDNNWEKLYWLIEGMKNQSPEEIKKSASKIVEAFELDTGTKIRTN